MATKPTKCGHIHSRGELCTAGGELYAEALRVGHIARSAVEAAPCLMDLALLVPESEDAQWLQPVHPSTALAQLTRPIEREIRERRKLVMTLAETFEPLLAFTAQDAPTAQGITVLEGFNRINETLDRVTADCTVELLTVQPGSGRQPQVLQEALRRVEPLVNRGVRMRTLYQHTARHHPATQAYVERVGPHAVDVRTLEEIIDRLIIVDRKVAFVPARRDRTAALELRHDGLVEYLVGVFEQFWLHGVPWEEQISYTPMASGINNVQLAIARLLVDGHVDEAIARRLGMNVRTCRGHIAKLSATLGSGSRAQLGYLIARSGILDEDH